MNKHSDRKFLKNLLNTASPSGFEKKAAEIWKNEAGLFTKDVASDIHGNSMASIMGDSDRPKVIMLAGHIDEIGLMISYIDPEGFLYFNPVGGWDAQVLPGQRVRIYTQSGKVIKGVIGRIPIHCLSPEARQRPVEIDNLWIDTGRSKRYVQKNISVGDYAVIDYQPEFWGDILVSRSLDDKIGAFIALETLREIKRSGQCPKATVCAVATVQEEIGLRGAKTSAYRLDPLIGIAVEVTFASDYPQTEKKKFGDIKLGKGPVISVGPNITPQIYGLLVKTAKVADIPYQVQAAAGGTGTDANVIQLTRGGVATGLVSVPNRYMHSPCEVVNFHDVENTIKLLAAFCVSKELNKEFGL